MKSLRSPLAAALLAALALGLGACSDSSDPSGGTSNTLSQVQANDISSDMAQDMDELAELSMFDASNGIPLSSQAAIQGAPPAPCVTITPTPVVNSDGDAVPDSARFTYDACVFTRGNGAMTDSLGGTIDFIDPLPLAASIGVRHVFTNFTRARINTAVPLRSFMAVHNGTREWGGNADTLRDTVESAGLAAAWANSPTSRATSVPAAPSSAPSRRGGCGRSSSSSRRPCSPPSRQCSSPRRCPRSSAPP